MYPLCVSLMCIPYGAGNETRTRDPNLGKVVLYQLSYSRKHRLKTDGYYYFSVNIVKPEIAARR